jgi:hypothetical protein
LQLFAWGKLDGIPPNDVLNPRSFHDPLGRRRRGAEDRRAGAVGHVLRAGAERRSALAAWSAARLRAVRGAAAPGARAQNAGSPTTLGVPKFFSVAQLEGQGFVGLMHGVPVSFHTKNNPPTRQFDQGGIGVRLGGTVRSVDWDLYYYDGPETGPDAKLQTTALCNTNNLADVALPCHCPLGAGRRIACTCSAPTPPSCSGRSRCGAR